MVDAGDVLAVGALGFWVVFPSGVHGGHQPVERVGPGAPIVWTRNRPGQGGHGWKVGQGRQGTLVGQSGKRGQAGQCAVGSRQSLEIVGVKPQVPAPFTPRRRHQFSAAVIHVELVVPYIHPEAVVGQYPVQHRPHDAPDGQRFHHVSGKCPFRLAIQVHVRVIFRRHRFPTRA